MPTYTLRPNANWSGATQFDIVGGAGSIHAALSDNSDTTFIRKNPASAGFPAAYQGEVGTSTIPANERVLTVNLRVRYQNLTSLSKMKVRLGVITDRNAKTVSWSTYVPYFTTTSGIVTVDTALNLTSSPTGSAWSQAAINNLVFELYDESMGGVVTDHSRYYEVFIDVVTTIQPTVTVTTPTGTVTDTSFPPINWTYTDTEGDIQSAYQIKIFDSATYSAGGFSPDTSSPYIDTGVVASSDAGAVLTLDLANNTTYRAYVRAAQLASGVNYFSNWAFSQFTMNLESPAAPQVSGFYDPSTGATTVTVLGRTNMLSANQASLETDTTGWVAQTNCSIARSTAQADHGSASLSLTATASGDMSAVTTTGTAFPVSALGSNSATARFRANSTGRSCRVGIEWRTAGGSVISTVFGSNVTNNSTGWVTATVTASAPSNAASARVVVSVVGAGASEVHFVDRIGFHAGSSPTWTIGGFTNLTFVVERSADALTWTAVRGSPVAASAAQTASVVDFEAPVSQTVTYRCQARGNL